MAPVTQKITKYVEGEKILCYHGPLIYEAKCLKIRASLKDSTPEYMVHYAGWNKNWDEWVSEGRILKYNEANLAKQKDLQKTYKKKPTKKSKCLSSKNENKTNNKSCTDDENMGGTVVEPVGLNQTIKSRSCTPNSNHKTKKEPKRKRLKRINSTTSDGYKRNKKGKHDYGAAPLLPLIPKIKFKLTIPNNLRLWLVDDYDFVVRQKKLVNLPAITTVKSMLDNYLQFRETCKKEEIDNTYDTSRQSEVDCIDNATVNNNNSVDEDFFKETVRELREYFNILLGSRLLLKFERAQYAELLSLHPNKSLTEIYGAHHFLRLFVTFDTFLHNRLNQQNCNMLAIVLNDLLLYLDSKVTILFTIDNYGTAPPEYHRRTM